MFATPGEWPVTTPDAEPTPATQAGLEFHVPPLVLHASVVVAPLHIVVVPVIAAGSGLTVMVLVAVAIPQLSETE